MGSPMYSIPGSAAAVPEPPTGAVGAHGPQSTEARTVSEVLHRSKRASVTSQRCS